MLNLAVKIHKINEAKVFIDTEDFDFLCLMRDFFSFFADGYKFHPAYRNKQWDGKIRLLGQADELPIGLWQAARDFCLRHGKECFIDPEINVSTSLTKEAFEGFVKELDIHTGGESIDPYDYQIQAAYTALTHKGKLLLSPTSSGKSLIQYLILRVLMKVATGKILIVVPTKNLVSQMRNDFKDYSSANGWDVDSFVGGVDRGQMDDKPIIIATYQSLSNAKTRPDPEVFEDVHTIMVDEVHTATAKSIKYIVDNCINAPFRVGLTGTLSECKTNEMVLRGMFGEVFQVIETHELMSRGAVAQLSVKCGLLDYPDDECKKLRSKDTGEVDDKGKKIRKKYSYAEEISYLVSHTERNKFVMRLAASLEGNTVLMINQVEHGENLYRWMKEAFPDRSIYLYTGSVDTEERDRIKELMEKEDNAIIIGSLGVLSTGISIKRLHNMIFAHPSKSRVKVLQSVGRLLRKSKFGNIVTMYDLIDDFSIGAYENYTLEHGRDRVRFYNDQLFDTEVFKIEIGERL